VNGFRRISVYYTLETGELERLVYWMSKLLLAETTATESPIAKRTNLNEL